MQRGNAISINLKINNILHEDEFKMYKDRSKDTIDIYGFGLVLNYIYKNELDDIQDELSNFKSTIIDRMLSSTVKDRPTANELVDLEFLSNLVWKQSKRCVYCNIKMMYRSDHKNTLVSVERKNNDCVQFFFFPSDIH